MRLILSKIRLETSGGFSLELDREFAKTVTGIFGPSGAGKTTLLEAIAGLRRIRSGRIELNGRVLEDPAGRIHRAPESRRVGYVPQDLALFPHLTVEENLAFSARSRTGKPGMFDHVIQVLEIGSLLQRHPAGLSGGEKQRVAVGRALLSWPELLVLDEPLASLDQPLKKRSLELLGRIKAEFEIPILYVSHDAGELMELCDEVLVLESGRCIRAGIPHAVFVASEPRFVPR